ncbi:MAG: DUF342 domain-containing protein [Lachnospiraceae bacterium]|nr:DUF342 domain-containing protein [Lachnospiraceae bacterium]
MGDTFNKEKMFKSEFSIPISQRMEEYKEQGFDTFQLAEIELGLKAGVDVKQYAKRRYIFFQMAELRKGLISKVDISLYSDVYFDWFQMREIRRGLEEGVDVSIYRDRDLDHLIMREVRKGLVDNINLMPYVKRGLNRSILQVIRHAKLDNVNLDSFVDLGYDSSQLDELRKGIKYNLNITEYENPLLSGAQMREIRYGLRAGIDISAYNNISYNWMQMQEIRLGIMNGVDVFWYDNPYFNARQMREIRLGLEAGLDVFSYATQIWSATDMHRMREKLIRDREEALEQERLKRQGKTTSDNTKTDGHRMDSTSEAGHLSNTVDEGFVDAEPTYENADEVFKYEGITGSDIYLELSSDEMVAELVFPKTTGHLIVTRAKIEKLFESNGVKQGIKEQVIERLATGYIPENGRVVVAEGTPPVHGKDGYYYFMFKTELPTMPKVKSDGSVDYKNVDLFELVEEGQKIAVFYPATSGSYGFTVKGKLITPVKGKNPPKLTGSGFRVLDDGVTYIAALSGSITYSNYTVKISNLYHVKGDVTASSGNIRFNGDVHVSGFVGSGVTIEAEGNIIIDGNVEAAIIKAGNDVLIRSGVSGRDEGIIKAGRNIYGKYFENIVLRADNNIESNYILNCESIAMNQINVSGEKGAIVGGTTYAIYGINASVIGNQAEIKTVFEIGANKYYKQRVKDMDSKIEEAGKKALVLKQEMERLIANRTPDELKSLTLFQNVQASLINKLHELETLKSELNEFTKKKEKAVTSIGVRVKNYAYPGVMIRVDDAHITLTDIVCEVFFRRQNVKITMFSLDDEQK